jgi:hypothetical protein
MNSINRKNEYQEHPFCTFFNSVNSDADKKGPAVYTARALLRGIDAQRQEYMHECEKVYPSSLSNRESLNQLEPGKGNQMQSDLSMIPNPATNFIALTHMGLYSNLVIEETNGKVVLAQLLNQTASIEQIDVSSLSNGMYLVKLYNANNTSVIKLIINK